MDFPTGPDKLSAAWLTQVLKQHGTLKGGMVASCRVDVLGGAKGAIGQIARVRITYDRDQPNAPDTLMAKFPSSNPAMRAMINQGGWYEREIRFYNELADKVALRTPHCYFNALDTETGEFVLLLEDLAPARNGSRAAGCSPAEAELAIREIAKFHAGWWEDPRLAQEGSLWSPLDPDVYQRLQARYQECWAPFVATMAPDLPEPILTLGEQARHKVANILAQFANPLQTLVHNDYTLDNLFFETADS